MTKWSSEWREVRIYLLRRKFDDKELGKREHPRRMASKSTLIALSEPTSSQRTMKSLEIRLFDNLRFHCFPTKWKGSLVCDAVGMLPLKYFGRKLRLKAWVVLNEFQRSTNTRVQNPACYHTFVEYSAIFRTNRRSLIKMLLERCTSFPWKISLISITSFKGNYAK